ncbi:MAG: 3-hydroxyisobutyrate dehydrogenase [Alphaproteobacteria bacterium]|jgi:3-hydroxyisobutyrate dehydrogenase|nr:3-hydroxyisobutyrate dehydrogenase [Alphaproteobacteria bacterium]
MAAIAFIGVGNMGGPMARNLVAAGHRVTVFDLAPGNMAAVPGAAPATSPAAAAAGAEVVLTMLPSGEPVRDVYVGQGVIAASADNAVLIDCSTIDVATARVVAEAAASAGRLMVDAPVSGGTGGAEAGTLTFMVGGPEAAFTAARPILERMGRTIVHAGPAGTGQAAKICNNMLLGISMIGTCEAFVLAEKLGLDPQKLFDISSTSSGQNWSLTTYCPVPGPVPASPANRDYRPGFAAAMMLKDLRLAQEAAAATGTTTPLGAEAAALYGEFIGAGKGGADFSGIIDLLRSIGWQR